jgi:spore coat protein U domain-containing protein, fimbrial subunit CupE1/2/3/6
MCDGRKGTTGAIARWIATLVSTVVLGYAAIPTSASAQSCNFTISALNFGSINLSANTPFTSTATYSASCTGTANTTIRTCPNIDVGSGGSTSGNPRFLLNGGTQLNFNLYQDGAYTSVWGSNLWGFAGSYPSPTVDVALNGSGSGSASMTMYGQVWSGQQTLSAGTYSSTFSGSQASVSYDYATNGTCSTIGSSHATSAAFTVSATNATICSVSAAPLNFPQTGVLQSAVTATTTVTLTCTNSAPYTVALDGGLSGATDPTQRKMTLSSAQITYGLYQDAARTQPWGDSAGTNTVAGTGSGLTQSLTVYGRVPAQNTPAPGTYSDTVVVTVTY